MPQPVAAHPANQLGQAPSETSELNASIPTESTAQTQDLTAQHIATLKRLDEQHNNLSKIENSLEESIQDLQREEKILRMALDQSTISIKEQRERDKTKKEEAAVARLEEALMGGDSSDSDDEMIEDVDNLGNEKMAAD